MKTIEQAAKEYAETRSKSDIWKVEIEKDFKAGAEFAQRWIPVDEEPMQKGVTCLVKTYNDDIGLAFNDGDNVYVDYKKFKDILITHWRPINLK